MADSLDQNNQRKNDTENDDLSQKEDNSASTAQPENQSTVQDECSKEMDNDWVFVEKPENRPIFPGTKYFILLAGKTMDSHNTVMNRLKKQIPNLQEVKNVDECDFILVFCPVVTRAGTDIEAALEKLLNISGNKPVFLVVLHHTFDPECVVPDSRRAVTRANTIAVDCLFHEDQGLLQCPKNDKSFAIVTKHMSPPVQNLSAVWFVSIKDGIGALTSIYEFTGSLVSWLYSQMPSFSFLQGQEKTQELSIPELRLMLLERTQPEESSARNILNKNEVAGRKVKVVNAPDWFSPGLSLENLIHDVGHYLREAAPGPHAFLLVIPVKHPTGEERGMLEKMEEIFGEGCWRNTIIIFNVTEEKRNNEEFIKSADEEVQRLVKKCGNRFHCLNIKESENDSQVSELLEKIETMVKGIKVKFYSSETYQETKKEIERLIEQTKKRAEGEMKEEPKMDDKFMKFFLPELWKYILTIKYKDEGNRLED